MSRTVRGLNKAFGQKTRVIPLPVKPIHVRADLESMLKAELVELASGLGLTVSASLKKSELVDAILEG